VFSWCWLRRSTLIARCSFFLFETSIFFLFASSGRGSVLHKDSVELALADKAILVNVTKLSNFKRFSQLEVLKGLT
jgi:hypothetical protein